MPEKGLRLVLSLDRQTSSYKPVAHNLPEQDVDGIQRQQPDPADTLAVEQKSHHRASKAEKCKACRETASEYTARRSDGGTEIPAAQDRESEV